MGVKKSQFKLILRDVEYVDINGRGKYEEKLPEKTKILNKA